MWCLPLLDFCVLPLESHAKRDPTYLLLLCDWFLTNRPFVYAIYHWPLFAWFPSSPNFFQDSWYALGSAKLKCAYEILRIQKKGRNQSLLLVINTCISVTTWNQGNRRQISATHRLKRQVKDLYIECKYHEYRREAVRGAWVILWLEKKKRKTLKFCELTC